MKRMYHRLIDFGFNLRRPGVSAWKGGVGQPGKCLEPVCWHGPAAQRPDQEQGPDPAVASGASARPGEREHHVLRQYQQPPGEPGRYRGTVTLLCLLFERLF